jgi:acetylornithine/succinyldiaminopimelate/putrescine aminotransferase
LAEKYPFVKGVRGVGLILGLEMDRPAAPVVEACRRAGFLINCTQDKILRFLPPLVVKKAEIDLLLDKLDQILAQMNSSRED